MTRALVALLLLAVSVSGALGDSRKHRGKGDAGVDAAVQRAVSDVNKRYQGRVLSAQPVKSGGKGIKVRIKFLSKDGVIKTLLVEPGED